MSHRWYDNLTHTYTHTHKRAAVTCLQKEKLKATQAVQTTSHITWVKGAICFRECAGIFGLLCLYACTLYQSLHMCNAIASMCVHGISVYCACMRVCVVHMLCMFVICIKVYTCVTQWPAFVCTAFLCTVHACVCGRACFVRLYSVSKFAHV